MKKLTTLLVGLIALVSATFAQPKQTIKKETKTVQKTQTTKDTVHLKKDGTPDKRYKETKTTSVTTTKKDGTPDMRYKENKKSKKN